MAEKSPGDLGEVVRKEAAVSRRKSAVSLSLYLCQPGMA